MSKIWTQLSSFFHSSSKINNYYFIIFLRRPFLDLNFPLMPRDVSSSNYLLSEADMLEWLSSEWKNINREWASLFITYMLIHWGAWVSGEVSGTRERLLLSRRSSLCFRVLPLVLILSLRKLRGFILYGFPEENSLCLLSLVLCLCFIVLHVILLVKDPKIIMVAYMIKI